MNSKYPLDLESLNDLLMDKL